MEVLLVPQLVHIKLEEEPLLDDACWCLWRPPLLLVPDLGDADPACKSTQSPTLQLLIHNPHAPLKTPCSSTAAYQPACQPACLPASLPACDTPTIHWGMHTDRTITNLIEAIIKSTWIAHKLSVGHTSPGSGRLTVTVWASVSSFAACCRFCCSVGWTRGCRRRWRHSARWSCCWTRILEHDHGLLAPTFHRAFSLSFTHLLPLLQS